MEEELDKIKPFKFEMLEKFNLVIDCENFDPEGSKVTLRLAIIDTQDWMPLIDNDPRWNSATGEFKKVIYILNTLFGVIM